MASPRSKVLAIIGGFVYLNHPGLVCGQMVAISHRQERLQYQPIRIKPDHVRSDWVVGATVTRR